MLNNVIREYSCLKSLILISVVAFVAACGGGSTTSSDTTALLLSSTSPADGAIDVARDAVVSAEFNEDILNTSVDESSVQLMLNDEAVEGTVSFDALSNTASLTPSSELALLGEYTATVTTGIADLSGNSLSADQSWSFTVSDGMWGIAELIEADDDYAFGPQIAFDASGNALAVWRQSDGTNYNILSNRYSAESGDWDATVVLIEEGNDGNAAAPQIAIDASGNALAVWVQSDGTNYNIYSNRYSAESGWDAATAVLIEEGNDGHASTPQIAIDASGNALAVWRQYDGTNYNILSNYYSAELGYWDATAELIEAGDGFAEYPQIAIDASGNALAVWRQSDGANYNIYSNRYSAGSGWGIAELIETGDGQAYFPQIVIDASGNALAVWFQHDGTRYNIWSNRYSADSGWNAAAAVLIETGDGDAEFPQIAIDASGNALVVWRQSDGTNYNIYSNRYSAGSGWGIAELIEAGDGQAESPQIAIDASGNALAVWVQTDGTYNSVYSNRYSAESGWDAAEAELIEDGNDGDAYNPQIAIDASGNALAVWRQYDGTNYNIWSNRFD